jgi:uncharacterized protein (AIM24 family)
MFGARSHERQEEEMSVEQTLANFRETETAESFSLQNSKLLKVELSGATIQAKLGSMVAHQGDVKFEHAGSGGVTKFMKKAVTGEGTDLMKVSGTGEVFLADLAQDIQLLRLENESITANGANVLAFEEGIDWDIKRVEGASGMLGGGLYNMHLQGTGYVAIISDGPPLLIEVNGESTFADPQAAITWSSGLTSSVKADVNMKTLIGRGSGETMQLSFAGQGWVLIQPSEGRVTRAAAGGSGGAGGAGGAIGKFLQG